MSRVVAISRFTQKTFGNCVVLTKHVRESFRAVLETIVPITVKYETEMSSYGAGHFSGPERTYIMKIMKHQCPPRQ